MIPLREGYKKKRTGQSWPQIKHTYSLPKKKTGTGSEEKHYHNLRFTFRPLAQQQKFNLKP